MYLLPDILARSDDTDAFKIIFGVIVAIIWGIASLVAALNKKAAEAKRRQQFGQLPSGLPQGQYPRVPVPARVFQPGPPQPVQKKSKKKAAVPPPITFHAATPENRPVDEGARSPSAAPLRTAAATATAKPSRIGRLIRRPDSLRAAFILSQVLEPPKSIRPERGQIV